MEKTNALNPAVYSVGDLCRIAEERLIAAGASPEEALKMRMLVVMEAGPELAETLATWDLDQARAYLDLWRVMDAIVQKARSTRARAARTLLGRV